MKCKLCGSADVIKWGKYKGVQRYYTTYADVKCNDKKEYHLNE